MTFKPTIRDKRKLQLYASISVSALIMCLGLLSASYAVRLMQSSLEQQVAEDNEMIGENLRIIFNQLTREYKDPDLAIGQVQQVLEGLKAKGWKGFACVLDKNGRVLAHPRREFVGMQVRLDTYRPTSLLGSLSPDMRSLQNPNTTEQGGAYRTESDIIVSRWLPEWMTYLCVHQSYRPVSLRLDRLRKTLIGIGIGFVSVAAAGTWVFVGWLVERYESHISRSEARNRVLVQNSAPIIVADHDGSILDANAQAGVLFRTAQEGLLGKNLEDLWVPEQRHLLEGLLHSIASNEVVERSDLDLLTVDGGRTPVDLRACPIEYSGKNAIYLLIRDITESRRAKEEILEANRSLQELDKLKTDFLNTVSHELRTPLTSMRWSAESLSELVKEKAEGTVQKLLRIIREDNQRLSILIEQLLSFSRLDAGRLMPSMQSLALAPILKRALEEVTPISEKKGVKLTWSDVFPEVHLTADPEQLQQVFVNILDNAIKYTPPGGEVRLSCEMRQGWVTIDVEDNGIGIPEQDRKRIFEKFYRVDRPDVEKEKGTGLGLAIVKGITEAHGGEIQVESTEDLGSKFTLRLPEGDPQAQPK